MNTQHIKQLANQLSSQTTDTLADGLTIIRKRPVTHTLIGIACVCAGVLFTVKKKGLAQKAGERVDDAADKLSDRIHYATS